MKQQIREKKLLGLTVFDEEIEDDKIYVDKDGNEIDTPEDDGDED